MKIRTMLFCGALVAMGASCRSDETAHIDDQVADKTSALEEAQQDVNEARGIEAKQAADVAHASADLANAEIDFSQRRDAFVEALRDRFRVYATQAAAARGILADPNLTEADRADATERVMTFERELGEAQQAIDATATATAAQWDSARLTVENAFDQLRGAEFDAFWTLGADRKIVR